MKFLVTGASGFIGGALVRLLVDAGYSVNVLARNKKSLDNLNSSAYSLFEGNLMNRDTLRLACEGCVGVFHAAAKYTYWVPDVLDMYNSNVEGTKNVIEAALAAGVKRLVYTSTVGTLKPDSNNLLVTEKNLAHVNELPSHYKKSKLIAEQLALSMSKKIEIVIVKPTAPFGPWDTKPTPTGKIVRNFLSSRLTGYIDTGMNVCDVDDVAQGHLLAFEKGQSGHSYILGSENMSLKRIYTLLSEITGIRHFLFKVPMLTAYAAAAIDEFVRGSRGIEPFITKEALSVAKIPLYADCSKATTQLDYRPRSAVKALKRSVNWFKNYKIPTYSKA